ncbi:MAG: 2-hydroxyacid dehydrogenase [Acetobacteraceae bacterium]
MKPELLLAIDLAPRSRALLEAAYVVHPAITPQAREAVAQEHGARIRAIVTNGTTILPAALIESLPQLGIICAQGVGYEGIDLAAARARGIVVTHGPGTNASSVADHAMALLLAALRDLPRNDAMVRAGRWRDGKTMRPMATGRRLGLLGLGQIGALIARRAAGFDMPVAYHTRSPRPDSGLTYVPTLLALAAWADILVVAVPGGASTRHMVNAEVLAALGPEGFLVNIGRGSVVDTTALVAALHTGGLAGAALDVIDGEPEVPQELRDLTNVVLTPHMAGRSPEAMLATITLVLSNLEAYFAGRPVLTPVPEATGPQG